MIDCTIRGGLVADGTGAPLRRADVAVDRGVVVAVGEVDERARRVVDATDLVVAPGTVDLHTHYDAQLFWDGAATPSSVHGVTTVIGGNCGFSIAPLEPSQAPYLAAMLARVEGIPLESLEAGVPWDWRSFGDYLDALEGRVAVNVGFLVGHTALRRLVMGDDDERRATPEELTRLEHLLGESLAAGGLGFSSSVASSHNDAAGRAVSSRYASRDEILRLCAVTGAHEGTTVEFIPTIAAHFTDDDMSLMTEMSVTADRPVNWNVLNVNTTLWDGTRQRLTASDHAAAAGGKVVALAMPVSSTLRLNFVSGFVLDSFPGWDGLFRLPEEERLAELADPARRAQLRDAVERGDSTVIRRVRNWSALVLEQTFAPTTAALAGRAVGAVAAERGVEPFDCLLDVVVADGLRTIIKVPPIGNDPESWALRTQVLGDERVVVGGSDVGADLDMIDTFVYATSLLGPVVRDGRMSLPAAVRLLTDVPARLYGIRGRGRVAPGWCADLQVFDPERVGPGPVEFRHDLPGGAGRLYAEAEGIRHVLVNGVETVTDGVWTGARDGRVLRSGTDTDTVRVRPAAGG